MQVPGVYDGNVGRGMHCKVVLTTYAVTASFIPSPVEASVQLGTAIATEIKLLVQ